MKSTPFLLEVLVIGIQIIVTFGLWIIAIFGCYWIPWNILLQWKSFLGFYTLILAYLLGLIYDYLMPTHFSSSEDDKPSIAEKVAFIHLKNPEIWNHLNDLCNRMKIARLSKDIWWFQFAGLITYYVRFYSARLYVILIILFLGVTVSVLARKSWNNRMQGYLLCIRRRFNEIKSEEDEITKLHSS